MQNSFPGSTPQEGKAVCVPMGVNINSIRSRKQGNKRGKKAAETRRAEGNFNEDRKSLGTIRALTGDLLSLALCRS